MASRKGYSQKKVLCCSKQFLGGENAGFLDSIDGGRKEGNCFQHAFLAPLDASWFRGTGPSCPPPWSSPPAAWRSRWRWRSTGAYSRCTSQSWRRPSCSSRGRPGPGWPGPSGASAAGGKRRGNHCFKNFIRECENLGCIFPSLYVHLGTLKFLQQCTLYSLMHWKMLKKISFGLHFSTAYPASLHEKNRIS